jgi:uncharacterized protein with WD repeat
MSDASGSVSKLTWLITEEYLLCLITTGISYFAYIFLKKLEQHDETDTDRSRDSIHYITFSCDSCWIAVLAPSPASILTRSSVRSDSSLEISSFW